MSHESELIGTTCRCGRHKRSKAPLCTACFYALPNALHDHLFRSPGYGYEEAYQQACEYLDRLKTTPPAPEAA